MMLDKSHQKPKSNQHHYIDVLEHGVIIRVVRISIMDFCANKNPINDDNNNLDEKEQKTEDFAISWVVIHEFIWKDYNYVQIWKW